MPQPEREVDRSLPGYAPELAAYHRAYRQELRAMLRQLPLSPGRSVLDVACGDAVYSRWFRELVETGMVVALDISHRWLQEADRAGNGRPALCRGNTSQLPFGGNRFDLVWCAQSLYSLPDLPAALREMVRVTRRGGMVAVLEDDALHQVLLPWPPRLELAIRRAEHEAFDPEPDKFYIGRRMTRMLREVGLQQVFKKAWASNRQAPLTQDEQAFLLEYLGSLRRRVEPHLGAGDLAEFDGHADPDREESFLRDPDLSVTCIDFVVSGIKP